uniref:RNA-directed RNA polymerase n=1 Tax=Panagrellus redivivus TaxID=6233 RepID=A0A7E4VDK7_PANRE
MEALVKVWKGNEPPEAAEQKPDFMQQNYASTYQSNRLLGHVYRKIQEFVKSVSKYVSQEDDQPVIDKAVHVDGWELYKDEAEAVYGRYSEEIKRVMTSYGVKNEAELFSQCFTDAKNRQLQNRENDSFSSHTTGATIQKQLYEIWCQFRQEFYAAININCAQVLANGKKEFLQTQFTSVLDDPVMGRKLRQMAVAYYKVAYQKGDIISFPWVVWDAIDAIRFSKNIPIDSDPLGNRISLEIEHKKFSKYDDFVKIIWAKLPNVMPYIARYNGLGSLLYFLCKWKEEHDVLAEVSKTEIIVMFMKYATGQLFNVPGVLEHVDIAEVSESMHNVDLKSRTGGLGRMLLTFFIEKSSDSFFEHVENWLVVPTFGGNNLGDEFCDIKKWRAVQRAARDTYFPTVFQSSSSILYSDATKGCVSRPAIVEIGEYFTIDVLASFHDQLNDNLMRALCDLSGCTHISMNVPELTHFVKTKPSYTLRVTLMPKGTPEAINRLRSLLTIDAPVSRNDNPADIMYLMKLNMTNQLKKLFKAARSYVLSPVDR